MKARVLYRTHYQVEEPAYVSVIIRDCSSPVQAAYSETIAERLAREISSRGKKFNVAAARYAVDLAHALGVLTEANTWTEKGHLFALFGKRKETIEAQMELDMAERLSHFRIFLEADGAAFLYIARAALLADPEPLDHDWNKFAGEMFNKIFSEYLAETGDISDRLSLRRELERLKSPFTGKTGAHKAFIHLQTMFRLGLLQRSDKASREYKVSPDMRNRLSEFVQSIPKVMALEEIAQSGTWFEIAAPVFLAERGSAVSHDELLSTAAVIYRRIADTGVPLCSLSTLTDAINIQLMMGGFSQIKPTVVINVLTQLQKQYPRDIRFHVDRRGSLAFVKLSDDLADRLVKDKIA